MGAGPGYSFVVFITWFLVCQAAERSAELEAAAREAARCEVALDSLRQWLGTVRDGGHVPVSDGDRRVGRDRGRDFRC